MKSLFEGIAFLFTDVLFVPFDMMRELELTNWWAANAINWLLILFVWAQQLIGSSSYLYLRKITKTIKIQRLIRFYLKSKPISLR